jgi:2-iminobutanoate/2-iminopropanoate deaminase
MMFKSLLMLTLAGTLVAGCTTHQPVSIERKHYGDWEKDVGYTQAVRIGNTLYLSGLGGQGETQVEQLNDVYQTIGRILADYKATSRDIVKEVIYTTNIDELIAAKDKRKDFYRDAVYPASTWVQVERLYSVDMAIEVDVTVQLSGRE